MSKEITLDEFMRQERIKMQKFFTYWKRSQEQDFTGENYPDTMVATDWHKHLDTFNR